MRRINSVHTAIGIVTITHDYTNYCSYKVDSMLIQIQPDATVCRYLFTAKSLYMFQVSQHPSSGVLKTVTMGSATGHDTGTATSLQRGPIGGK